MYAQVTGNKCKNQLINGSNKKCVDVLNTDQIKDIAPLNQIKVLAYRDKGDWILETKYNIGSKKKKNDEEG